MMETFREGLRGALGPFRAPPLGIVASTRSRHAKQERQLQMDNEIGKQAAHKCTHPWQLPLHLLCSRCRVRSVAELAHRFESCLADELHGPGTAGFQRRTSKTRIQGNYGRHSTPNVVGVSTNCNLAGVAGDQPTNVAGREPQAKLWQAHDQVPAQNMVEV
jgi:hypothetical protein